MNEKINRILSLDRDEMPDLERELFLKDIRRIVDEYFECDSPLSLEMTRSDDGFIVCVLFSARRIKNVRRPQ